MNFFVKKHHPRVVFFSRDLKIGGMEKALVVLLNQIASSDVKVHLVLQEKCGVLLGQLDPSICVKRYAVCTCKNVLLRKIVNLFHRLMWSVFHYRKYDFSCNYATYMTWGSKLAAIASKNSSLYVHSDYYHFFKNDELQCRDFFLQQGIAELKSILFVAEEAMIPIRKIFPEFSTKFLVISNLIDYLDIEKKADCPIVEKRSDRKLFLFVGRLEEESKRLSRLLKSFSLVCKQDDTCDLWIIGDGPEKHLCENLIEKYSLTDRVKMLGEKSNPYPYIKMADCMLLTSDFEGFPVIYNECLVLRTAMITTIPVSDDFIDFRRFSIVVSKDPKEISEAILSDSWKNLKLDSVDFDAINHARLASFLRLFR